MTEYHWQCLQGLWKESPPNRGFALVLFQITGANIVFVSCLGSTQRSINQSDILGKCHVTSCNTLHSIFNNYTNLYLVSAFPRFLSITNNCRKYV